ncbi:MAG: sigma-70 family RNA polymerase sigma factor, partial [Anaerovoracaceae bacterium]
MIIIMIVTLNDSERDLVNEIFQNYNVKLFNISFKILRSQSDAEDAVSNAFLKIIDHMEKISKLPYPQIVPY